VTQIEIGDEGFTVDADVLADAFALPRAEVQRRMASGAITSRCEKGVEEDAGRWRLTFFHAGRALRLTVDGGGRVLGKAQFDVPRRDAGGAPSAG
jgi:hypothetical protein